MLKFKERKSWYTLKALMNSNVILPSEFELNLKLDKFEVIEGTPEDREFVELLKEKENLARTYKAVDLFGAKPVEEANYDSSKGEIDWFPLNRPLSWSGWEEHGITPVIDLRNVRFLKDIIEIVNSLSDDEVLKRTNFKNLSDGIQLLTNKRHLVVDQVTNALTLTFLEEVGKALMTRT